MKNLILPVRKFTSTLPRIKGVGIMLAKIADFYRKRGVSDVEVMVFGRKMLLNPSDLISNHLIFTPQYYDYKEIKLIKKIVAVGDYIIDVGANIGAYTLIFADIVSPSGLVTCIEAEQRNAKRLLHNININGLYWVHMINFGVSDKKEVLPLLLNSTGNAGAHSFYEQSDANEIPIQEVECHPLSDLVDKTRKPKLIKLDIEGFEYRVLLSYFNDLSNSLWPEFIMLEDIPTRSEGDAVSVALDRGYKIIKRIGYNVFLKL